jgi:tetratricopeptide (TPR) repeat protein
MQEARKRFPDLPQITSMLALTLSKAKRHTEAMTTFAEAQAEAQNTHEELLTQDFYLEYGAAAEQAGLTDKAAELLKRAIELDPQNAAQAYNYLGYMWVDRGENLEEAGEMIRKAVEMEPENAAFIDSLGWFYFKKGEHEKALKELLRAAENLKPDDAVVFDHIGDAYLALGKMPEALLYWQKALALEKENKTIADKIEAAKQKVTSNAPAPAEPSSSAR